LPPVTFRQVSWYSAWPDLIGALASDSPPDVIQLGTSWVATLAHLGHLAPVPAGVVDRPPIAPWLADVVRYAGTSFAAPWLMDCSCLVARTDVLDRLGLTVADLADWSGFLSACERVGAELDDLMPIGLTCRREQATLHLLVPWLWAGGWQVPDLDAARVQALTSPAAGPGLDYLARLVRAGRNPEAAAAVHPSLVEDSFYQDGQFAFMLGRWWGAIQRMTDSGTPSKVPFVPLPLPVGPAGSVAFGGGSVLAVPSGCADPEAAWEVVHALLEADLLQAWAGVSGMPPALDGGFWQVYADHPEVILQRRSAECARAYPSHPLWRSTEALLSRGLGELMWGVAMRRPPADALALSQRVDDELNQLLAVAWDRA
jgi:multiple sugar transport system substrate-binding protein